MPGPVTRGASPDSAARLAANDECVRCHAVEADDWARSLHRHSFDNPVFSRAFDRGRPAFCQSCHAPESDPGAPVSAAGAALGVGCVTCHGTGDDVLAAPHRGARSDAPAPHGIVRSEAFGGTAACAACHEFEFPDRAARAWPAFMQRTLQEHRESAFSDRTCADCHMRHVQGPTGRTRSHDFSVVGDAELLRSAVEVSARRPSPGRVEVEVAAAAVGHAVPTGDLFRRLVVRVGVDGDAPQWLATRYLGRAFGSARPRGVPVVVERRDDRVSPARPSVVGVDVPAGAEVEALRWQVVYQRIVHTPAGSPARADVFSETVLASGTLASGGHG